MSYFDTASLDMHTELICLQRLHITYIHAHTHTHKMLSID